MRRPVGVVAALLALVSCGKADNPPEIQWQLVFGSDRDIGWYVQQTSDGGYIVAADSAAGFTSPDMHLLKTDSSGQVRWQRVYGGPGTDRASAVRQTPDGGYLLTGYMHLDSSRAVCLRLDSVGNVVWIDSGPVNAGAHDLDLTSDGGCITVGAQRGDTIYLRKLDVGGTVSWHRVLPGCLSRWVAAKLTVQQTTDTGYVVAAEKVFKVDPSGVLQWTRTFDDISVLFSIQQTVDGGYVATGIAPDPLVPWHTQNLLLLRLDSQGSKVWRKLFRNGAPADGRCVRQTADGGFFVVGNSDGVFLVRTDPQGNKTWSWSNSEPVGAFASWGEPTSDGGYVFVANEVLIRLAPDGQ